MATNLTLTCPRCEESVPVHSTDDELPDLRVKVRRVERACRACGETVVGLDAPEQCQNDDCPDPDRGFGPAERIVTRSFSVSLCMDCQDDLDTEAEVRAAIGAG